MREMHVMLMKTGWIYRSIKYLQAELRDKTQYQKNSKLFTKIGDDNSHFNIMNEKSSIQNKCMRGYMSVVIYTYAPFF